MTIRPAVLCVVGAKGSGKTTLIESVLPLLRAEGVRVGVLKHTHHAIQFDREGKDTWRHAQAGAEQVLLFGPNGLAYVDYRARERSPEEAISRYFDDVALVLIEGYKWGPLPKIEVFRPTVCEQPVCLGDPQLIAVVTDDPRFDGAPTLPLGDWAEIAAFMFAYIRKRQVVAR